MLRGFRFSREMQRSSRRNYERRSEWQLLRARREPSVIAAPPSAKNFICDFQGVRTGSPTGNSSQKSSRSHIKRTHARKFLKRPFFRFKVVAVVRRSMRDNASRHRITSIVLGTCFRRPSRFGSNFLAPPCTFRTGCVRGRDSRPRDILSDPQTISRSGQSAST